MSALIPPDVLARALVDAGYKPERLAAIVGVGRRTINRIIAREHVTNIDTYAALLSLYEAVLRKEKCDDSK